MSGEAARVARDPSGTQSAMSRGGAAEVRRLEIAASAEPAPTVPAAVFKIAAPQWQEWPNGEIFPFCPLRHTGNSGHAAGSGRASTPSAVQEQPPAPAQGLTAAAATNPRGHLALAAAEALVDALRGGDLALAREATATVGRILGARGPVVAALEAPPAHGAEQLELALTGERARDRPGRPSRSPGRARARRAARRQRRAPRWTMRIPKGPPGPGECGINGYGDFNCVHYGVHVEAPWPDVLGIGAAVLFLLLVVALGVFLAGAQPRGGR